MHSEEKYYTFDWWFGNQNPGIKEYQQITYPWFCDTVIPIALELCQNSNTKGIKCYLGTHDCESFNLWKTYFTDMIGFDLYNPVHNPYVIQYDWKMCDLLKFPVSFCLPFIGSTTNTPELVKKVHKWINKNLVTNGMVFLPYDHLLEHYTEFKILRILQAPYGKRACLIKKIEGTNNGMGY